MYMNKENTENKYEVIPFLEEDKDKEQASAETTEVLVKGAQGWEDSSSNEEEFYL